MIQNLISKPYKMEPDNLIMDINRTMDATLISMTSTQGVLKRGTLLGITSDYDYVVYGGADSQAASSGNEASEEDASPETATALEQAKVTPCYIVSDTIDLTEETKKVEVGVYTAGDFRKSAVIVAEGYELTEADLQELRKLGIILK